MTNQQMYLEYLDDLRDSGVVNMWGAGSFLEDAFGLSRREARDVLLNWMDTYTQRHPQGETQ